jgi:hypothetical protein
MFNKVYVLDYLRIPLAIIIPDIWQYTVQGIYSSGSKKVTHRACDADVPLIPHTTA